MYLAPLALPPAAFPVRLATHVERGPCGLRCIYVGATCLRTDATARKVMQRACATLARACPGEVAATDARSSPGLLFTSHAVGVGPSSARLVTVLTAVRTHVDTACRAHDGEVLYVA